MINSARLRAGRALSRRRVVSGDAGTTLVEVLVGMLIMTIFLGMFTAVVVMMNSAENKAEATNNSAAQINQAFLTLDKMVRQAGAISTPGQGAAPLSDWYVELRTTNSGSAVCTQLRVDNTSKQVQQRTWTPGATPGPSFSSVLNGVSTGTAGTPLGWSAQPFALQPLSPTVPFQQLTISLQAAAGSATKQTTSRSSFTFNAVNTTIPVPTTPFCQEGLRP